MSLIEQLQKAATAQIAGQAAQRSGMDEGLARALMPMAMAAVMGGLRKNAGAPDGAAALSRALERHDGGLLDNLDQLGSDDLVSDGRKILGHVLGGKQAQTEQALARTAGVSQDQVGQLLAMAAPAILGALGRAQRQQGLDADALAGLVRQETGHAERVAPDEIGGLMGFLDQDGDGDFKDDVLESVGKKLFSGVFGGN